MTAFESPSFFCLLAALSVPAIVLGLTGRRIRRYGMVATMVVLIALMWPTPAQAAALAGFLAFQTALMMGHLVFIGRHGRHHPWERRAAVLLALLPLALVKVTALFPTLSVGFLGVSYVTFRAVQVVVEISDGLLTRLPVLDYLYFLTFFPTLASGPIDRSRRFAQDADLGFAPADYGRLLGRGLAQLVLGAVYKFGIAAFFAAQLPSAGTGPLGLVRSMYLYGFDLFFDFAGYSAMAVGASAIFGIRTPPNFRLPFVAENIKDFWNRWHISLSFWFRDFIYTRLVMALVRRRVFANNLTASRLAYVVNMLAMGVWHGLAVHYVLYGAYHGLLLVLHDVYERSPLYAALKGRLWYRLLGIFVTFHLVMFGFLLFSGKLISN